MLLLGAVGSSLRERGELAANLGELRTIHEKLLNSLPFGLLWVDQRGVIGDLNQSGRSLLRLGLGVAGLRAESALGQHTWLLDALASDSFESYRTKGADGLMWEVRKILAPSWVGALVQFEDVTERENEERRRATKDRFAEIGEMAAGLAHQLKNGLAVLKGQGQLLGRQGFSEAAQEIIQEVSMLEGLMADFLRWAKPLFPELAVTDLAVVVDEAIAEIRRRPCALQVSLEKQGEGHAKADPVLLKEALLNIIENACQASPAGGKVLVHISGQMVEILDDGPGLGPEGFAKFIRPFESGRPDGTGLGLSLAFKWLNAQGADLAARDRESGGSIFVVKW
jgi:signal transduction histidine kinase